MCLRPFFSILSLNIKREANSWIRVTEQRDLICLISPQERREMFKTWTLQICIKKCLRCSSEALDDQQHHNWWQWSKHYWAKGENGDYILSVSFRSGTQIMKEARLWIWRRTMQSAAPDTSRQKQVTTAFPCLLIQFLSACLSAECIIILSSSQVFKDSIPNENFLHSEMHLCKELVWCKRILPKQKKRKTLT